VGSEESFFPRTPLSVSAIWAALSGSRRGHVGRELAANLDDPFAEIGLVDRESGGLHVMTQPDLFVTIDFDLMITEATRRARP